MKRLLVKCTLFAVLASLLVSFPLSASGKRESFYRDQVAVLIYHHIDPYIKGNVTITPTLFAKQIAFLKEHGYSFITYEKFKAFMAGDSVPDNAVLVTFDDGYLSDYTYAYPLLRKEKVPSVHFIITGFLESPLSGKLPFLSRRQIEEMTKGDPDFEVQCHSHKLHAQQAGKPLLTTRIKVDGQLETDEQYRKRITNDINACVHELQPLTNHKVDALAYPFGAYDDESKNIISATDIRYAFTVKGGMATRGSDPMALPRINAGSPFLSPQRVHNNIMRFVGRRGSKADDYNVMNENG